MNVFVFVRWWRGVLGLHQHQYRAGDDYCWWLGCTHKKTRASAGAGEETS